MKNILPILAACLLAGCSTTPAPDPAPSGATPQVITPNVVIQHNILTVSGWNGASNTGSVICTNGISHPFTQIGGSWACSNACATADTWYWGTPDCGATAWIVRCSVYNGQWVLQGTATWLQSAPVNGITAHQDITSLDGKATVKLSGATWTPDWCAAPAIGRKPIPEK